MDEWVGKAMEKERNGGKVFSTNDQATETSRICQISRKSIFNVRKKDVCGSSSGRKKISLDDFEKGMLHV